MIPLNLVTNSLLSPFCLFLETRNKNHIFRKLVVWLREIFLLSLKRVALLFKAMSNSIDFYKEISYILVIPVFIIVPCCNAKKYLQTFSADASARST